MTGCSRGCWHYAVLGMQAGKDDDDDDDALHVKK